MGERMNGFLTPHAELDKEFPRRIYARLDQSEVLSPSNNLLLFDGIDADDFDRLSGGTVQNWIANPGLCAQAGIFAVAIESIDLGPSAPPASDSEDDTLGWYHLELERDIGGPVLVYPNLFADGLPSYLRSFEQVPKGQADRLDAAFDLTRFEVHVSDILEALRSVPAPEHVAVYDVGQGAASALIAGMAPRLYFDLGGGVQRHHNTFPKALKRFCYTHRPPVVLSHWDWDHWSSGARFEATNLTWIAPNQKLGAAHAVFAANVASYGRLLIWPPDAGKMSFARGHARILQCTGNGRNHSGLALEVYGPEF